MTTNSGWRAEHIAWTAIVLSFVSQFFQYEEDTRGGMLHRATDERYYTGISFFGSAGGTGWAMHPHAWITLAALAVVYSTGTHAGRFWSRWGYWLTAAGILASTVPGRIAGGAGALLGAVAFGIAIWAAIRNRREQQLPPPA